MKTDDIEGAKNIRFEQYDKSPTKNIMSTKDIPGAVAKTWVRTRNLGHYGTD